ncbi:hypothetical protein QE152_g5054 [Popillia japonica]|uniref:Endonuclease-reverse transcriptase n=1 Tax=Popillia japonica TaxID=7064 RepID=A0AAW1MY93_POPJA
MGWWGHLHRLRDTVPVKRIWESRTPDKRKDTVPVKRIWESRTPDKRKRGRPKVTWDDTIRKNLRKKEKTWPEAKQLARDRKQWNKFIKKQNS